MLKRSFTIITLGLLLSSAAATQMSADELLRAWADAFFSGGINTMPDQGDDLAYDLNAYSTRLAEAEYLQASMARALERTSLTGGAGAIRDHDKSSSGVRTWDTRTLYTWEYDDLSEMLYVAALADGDAGQGDDLASAMGTKAPDTEQGPLADTDCTFGDRPMHRHRRGSPYFSPAEHYLGITVARRLWSEGFNLHNKDNSIVPQHSSSTRDNSAEHTAYTKIKTPHHYLFFKGPPIERVRRLECPDRGMCSVISEPSDDME